MGVYIPQYGFGRQHLQQEAPAAPAPSQPKQPGQHPKLAIGGVELRPEAVAELRDTVSIADAVKRIKKDHLDQVFFEADGKRFVAYGKGMVLPKGLEKKLHGDKPEPVEIAFGAVKGRVLDADNEANTYREGVFGSIKRYGVWTGIKIGAVVGAAALGALGLGYLSKAVNGILHTAKTVTVGFFRAAAVRIGTSVPVAGVLICGGLLIGETVISALLAQHRKGNYEPVQGIIK